MARAQELISTAYRNITAEVPALARLKLTMRLELRGRGDIQVFRVRVPGPETTKGDPDDARIEISMPRSIFNELATDGKLPDWREAYEHGQIRISGDPEIQKLIGTVIERQEARARLRKAR
ncbi:MAG TPA: hypothetical protein VK919_13535 [Solirubrobacterales bacterium]|nr:hypothetical protein [Solirubrobacterales bacterium]